MSLGCKRCPQVLTTNPSEMREILCKPDMLPRFLCLQDIPFASTTLGILQCAAVLGRRFRLKMLLSLGLNLPNYTILTDVRKLVSRKILERISVSHITAAASADGSQAASPSSISASTGGQSSGRSSVTTLVIDRGDAHALRAPRATPRGADGPSRPRKNATMNDKSMLPQRKPNVLAAGAGGDTWATRSSGPEPGAEVDVDAEYMFSHNFVCEAVYNMVPREMKASVHLRAATLIASTGQAEMQLAEVARHFRLGGNSKQAMEFYQRAGDKDIHAENFIEARSCYQSLIEVADEELILDEDGDLNRWQYASWVLQLAIIQFQLHEIVSAIEGFKLVLSLCGHEVSTRKPSSILLQLRLGYGSRNPTPVSALRDKASIYSVARYIVLGDVHSVAAAAFAYLSEVFQNDRNGEVALMCNFSALRVAVRGPVTVSLLVRILKNMWIVALFSEGGIGQGFLDRAKVLCSGRDAEMLAQCVLAQGVLLIQKCLWGEAKALFQQLVDHSMSNSMSNSTTLSLDDGSASAVSAPLETLLSQTLLQPHVVERATWALAFIAFIESKFELALSLTSQCCILGARRPDSYGYIAWYKRLQVHIYILTGRLDLAAETASVAGKVYVALVQMHQGDFHMALHMARDVQELVHESTLRVRSTLYYDFLNHLARVELLMTVSERLSDKLVPVVAEQLRVACHVALSGLGKYCESFSLGKSFELLYSGMRMWHSHPEDAAALLQAAVTRARASQSEYPLSLAMVQQSRHMRPLEALEYLSEGTQILKSLGIHCLSSHSDSLSNRGTEPNHSRTCALRRGTMQVSLKGNVFQGSDILPKTILQLGGYNMDCPASLWGVCLEIHFSFEGSRSFLREHAIYQPMFESVREHGGDVFDFAVDRLLAIFAAPSYTASTTFVRSQIVYNAVVCYFEIAQILVSIDCFQVSRLFSKACLVVFFRFRFLLGFDFRTRNFLVRKIPVVVKTKPRKCRGVPAFRPVMWNCGFACKKRSMPVPMCELRPGYIRLPGQDSCRPVGMRSLRAMARC